MNEYIFGQTFIQSIIVLQSTSRRLKSHPLFDQMSEEEQEETMDGIEKHLMTSIYNK